MNVKSIKRILALAPHPDDVEFACGGTLKKFSGAGADIWYAVFSPCDKSLPKGFKENTLYQEMKKAIVHIGISHKKVITYDFPVRELPAYRQEILEELIKLKKRIKPDLVLLPNSNDLHQDHQTIYHEGVRAFKETSILGYEFPRNNYTATINFHVKLTKKQLDAKMKAVKEYKSQRIRKYHDEHYLTALAKVRGMQIGTEYAEGFEMIHWVM